MKQAKRRVWSILLACVMLLTMLPAGVWAADGVTEVADSGVLIEALKADGEIRLKNDITVTGDETLQIPKGIEVSLDLGGYELTLQNVGSATDEEAYYNASKNPQSTVPASIWNQGTLSVQNGAISGEAATYMLVNSGNLTLADDVVIEKTANGNAIDNLGGSVTSSADITVEGTNYSAIVTYGGSVTIEGGTIQADYGVDIFNRSYDNKSKGAAVTVNGGMISAQVYALSTNNLYSGGNTPSNVTINGGSLESASATVIYWPSAGKLTIGTEGGDDEAISVSSPAGSAIEVCSGTLEINSGTFAGSDSNDQKNDSATWAAEYRKNSGCAGLGDAVTVIARRGSGYDTASLSVTINGGTFESSDNYAVRYFDCNQVKGAQQIDQKVEFSIAGGRFTGPQGADAIDAEMMADTEKPFVSGGVFSAEIPEKYLSSGKSMVQDENGNWTVEQLPYVAAIGDKQYYTLAEAVAAAKDGDTIRLLSDASGSGIGTFYNPGAASGKNGVKNFTIDFGGHTYTCVGPAVGSSGTQSQAFHLEWNGKDNPNVNVTLKNGTITSTASESSGVQMLVQNYCNLTLDHMVLDGTNVTAGYTLSNNCGNVVIKDSTILAPESGVAFDVCDFASYTGVTVTVEGKSYVQGKIEVVNENGGDNNAKLVLEGGYYTVDQVSTAYSDSSAVKDLASYVAEGYSLIPSDTTGYLCMVIEKIVVEDVEIKPDVAAPEVSKEELEDEDMTETDENALVESAGKVEVTGIVSEAMDAAKSISENDVELAKKQLAESVTQAEGKTVTLYVQTYLDIKPKSYNSETSVLKLDVTPMVQVIASTAATADEIVTEEDETSEKPQNAVVYRKAEPLQLDKQDVTVTIQLPGTFTTTDDTAYVVHTKDGGTQYLYDGEVKSAGSNPILTFTNPNGFSDFTVYGADPAVARVYASDDTVGETGTGYMTLQQAVDNVPKDGFIVAQKSDSASVRRSISFTVSEKNDAVASISAGRGYRMTKVENGNGSVTYTFSRRSSSSSNSGSTGGIGTRLPVADKGSTPSVTGFESDTNADLTVDGRYQFRITSLDGHTPVLTVNNSNFTVTLASQSGRDYFYVITCSGAAGSTAAVSVDGKYLLTATVGGSASGVVSDTTHPFTVAQGGTYQFRLTAAARPSFAAGSASFTVEYAGQEGNDYFYKVHAVGQAGDGCGFYINGEAQPVAVATIG